MDPQTWLPPDLLAHPASPVLLGVTGALLLLAGRRLYWLFVGLAGAVGGLWVAQSLLGLQSGPASLVAALAAGLSGAILAVLVQKVMVAILGGLAGLWGAALLLGSLPLPTDLPHPDWVRLLLMVVAGVLGALAAVRLFDVALILLSSLAGALLLTTALAVPGAAGVAALTGFTALGLLIQGRILSRPVRRPRRRARAQPEG